MSPYKRLISKIKQVLSPAYQTKPTQSEAALPTQDMITHIPDRITRDQHDLSRRDISRAALKVLYQLHNAGYQALLVGGGVRDVLLGKTPKDFDIVTNAHPEEVRNLFSNCHLIGRRFVLAHVRFGREIIEVATFRASHENNEAGVTENGQIVRDNVYGTIDDDAHRRDFTINALYYDISDFAILDYAQGIDDLEDRIIRFIGDPILRYQEDPVRILRAIRFAAKLDFTIEEETAKPIASMANLLRNIPSSRLYDESLKLFLSGHAVAVLDLLYEYDVFKYLFPLTHKQLDQEPIRKLIYLLCDNTDKRIENQQSVAPGFFFAVLLWAPLVEQKNRLMKQGQSEQDAIINAAQIVLRKQAKFVSIPRRVTAFMHEVWILQPRLTRKKDKRVMSAFMHPRFRAGFDFLILRAEIGDEVEDSVVWWTEFQEMDEKDRPQQLKHSHNNSRYHRNKGPRRRRRRSKHGSRDS